MNNWTELLLGLLSGGSLMGVVGILTIPSAIKKAKAEAKAAEIHNTRAVAEAKSAEIENMQKVADGWKELADERQEANKEKDARIAELTAQVDARYAEIGEWRDKYNNKQEENTSLRVDLANEKVKLCMVRGCAQREPQSGY